MTIVYLISLFAFILYVSWLASCICRESLTEWLLTTFLLGAGSVILTGFILSALYQTANTPVWAVSVFITSTIVGTVLRRLIPTDLRSDPFWGTGLIQDRWHLTRRWFLELSPYLKFLFALLFGTLTLIAITNLLLVLFTVPNEWDSMTGHLNRVMQYIQRGSMRHFGGTNWNIDTYPKSVCTLQIYSFLITGRFENAFKFIHHLSYWTAIVAVFGIVQCIGQDNRNALSASFFLRSGLRPAP